MGGVGVPRPRCCTEKGVVTGGRVGVELQQPWGYVQEQGVQCQVNVKYSNGNHYDLFKSC